MAGKPNSIPYFIYPLTLLGMLVGVWAMVCASGAFHPSAFPSPSAVVGAFAYEIATGRLATDVVVSLFRVSCGFLVAVALGSR
jgi:NitT/TauT family transport system permease protein